MSGDDHDLQEFFAALRREEGGRVPPFSAGSLTTRNRVHRSWSGKRVAAAVCLATMLTTVITAALWHLAESRFVRQGSNREVDVTAISIVSWKPATDFLLETPGRELLLSVPAIGVWHGVESASRHGGRNRHTSK